MKRIYFLLIAIIFCAIAGQASLAESEDVKLAALSNETKPENIDHFFNYKVNHIQVEKADFSRSCSVRSAVCCHV